jgi:hypothetical protein
MAVVCSSLCAAEHRAPRMLRLRPAGCNAAEVERGPILSSVARTHSARSRCGRTRPLIGTRKLKARVKLLQVRHWVSKKHFRVDLGPPTISASGQVRDPGVRLIIHSRRSRIDCQADPRRKAGPRTRRIQAQGSSLEYEGGSLMADFWKRGRQQCTYSGHPAGRKARGGCGSGPACGSEELSVGCQS